MSKQGSNPPAGSAETVPEVAASRTPKDLDRTIRQMALRLRRDFAAEIAEDPAAFKRRAVHRLKVYLPAGPGRPCSETVTRAAEMRAQAKPWRGIYPACILGHATLDPPSRQVAQWHLRNAVRSRRNTRRRRSKARAGSSAATNPPADVSPSQPPRSAVA